MDWVWTWQLTDLGQGRTRVLQRNNMCLTPPWLDVAYRATMVPADFIMARSHLRGLRARAEAGPRADPDGAGTSDARPAQDAVTRPPGTDRPVVS